MSRIRKVGEFAVKFDERTGKKRRYFVEAVDANPFITEEHRINVRWPNGSKETLITLRYDEGEALTKILAGEYFGDAFTEWWENQGRKEYEEWRRNHEQQD